MVQVIVPTGPSEHDGSEAAPTKVTSGGSVSTTSTPAAASGPAFVIVSV